MSTWNRRQLLLATAAAAAAQQVRGETPQPGYAVCAFTKPFNSLAFPELARAMREIGFQGIEAPIRKGGHIEPPHVEERLPRLVEALAAEQLQLTVMTSDINDPSDPRTETLLRAAAQLGVPRYRMKYLKYDPHRPVKQQLASWRDRFRDLAAMNRELGIIGLYQNHAGDGYLGAALWDLAVVLDGIEPQALGVAFDIRHATVEGGMSWPTTFRMIQPHLKMVYVKDFVWEGKRPKNVPLGEGRVAPSFAAMLRQCGFDGPISLHEEYLDHRDPTLVPQHLAALRRDLATLRRWFG